MGRLYVSLYTDRGTGRPTWNKLGHICNSKRLWPEMGSAHYSSAYAPTSLRQWPVPVDLRVPPLDGICYTTRVCANDFSC